jgi:hypothetical protein
MKERAADAVAEDLRQFAAELASDSPPHPVIAERLAKFAARLEAYPSRDTDADAKLARIMRGDTIFSGLRRGSAGR